MRKRYLIFFLGLIIQSVGITLVVKSLLGTSPISSVPYVLSLALPFTFGQTTMAVSTLFVIAQFLIARKDFPTIQFLQIPVTIIFGVCIDISMYLLAWVVPEAYLWKIFVLLLGAILVALGVAFQILADVLMLSGEGIVYAISCVFKIEFGKVKTRFDCFLVASAVILSLYYLGTIEGVREGTLISALITGVIARFFIRLLKPILHLKK